MQLLRLLKRAGKHGQSLNGTKKTPYRENLLDLGSRGSTRVKCIWVHPVKEKRPFAIHSIKVQQRHQEIAIFMKELLE